VPRGLRPPSRHALRRARPAAHSGPLSAFGSDCVSGHLVIEGRLACSHAQECLWRNCCVKHDSVVRTPSSSNDPASCETVCCESTTWVVKISFDRASQGFHVRIKHKPLYQEDLLVSSHRVKKLGPHGTEDRVGSGTRPEAASPPACSRGLSRLRSPADRGSIDRRERTAGAPGMNDRTDSSPARGGWIV
jgi:hypothetical protein